MNRLLLFLSCFFVSYAFPQNIELTGLVTDSNSGEPVPFANVILKEAFIGTVTNEMGCFRLIIPVRYSNSNIEISSIGYSSALIKIDIAKTTNIKVELNPRKYDIGAVVVLPNGLTPITIFQKAIRNFNRHIAESSYMQDFFYRELTLTRDTFSFLMEAAATVCFPRFSDSDNKIRIRVNQIRRSSFFGDSESNWFFKLISKNLWGKIDNGIYYFWNRYSKMVNRMQLYTKEDLKNADIQLNGLTYIDSVKVFELQVKYKYEGLGRYYIRSDNFQIVKIVLYSAFPEVVASSSKGLIEGKYAVKFDINFVQHGRKLFFSHSILNSIPHSPSKKTISADYFQMQEIQVIANRTLFSGYKNIGKKESVGIKANLYELEYMYDSTFWYNYNGIILNPLLVQQKSDLERGMTLEQQYYSNQKPLKQ